MTDIRRKKSIKNMIGMMIFVLVAFLSSIIIYTHTIDSVKQNQQQAIAKLKEERFDQIYLYLAELKKQSYSKVLDISKNIEDDIKSKLNLKDLKDSLDSDEYTEELLNIFSKYTDDVFLNGVDNYKNGIIVMNNDGIIQDLNYSRANCDVTPGLRTWEHELKNTYNKQLYQNAIDKINDHSKSIIAIETIESSIPNHIKIVEANYVTLKNVYMKEGIEGLANYQILVPVYITKTGDIFGQRDIVQGKIQDTHKFIIVQEFNLYDQINANHNKIFDNSNIEIMQIEYQNVLNLLYILGILLIISVVIVVFYFTLMYNNFIIGYRKAMIKHDQENKT